MHNKTECMKTDICYYNIKLYIIDMIIYTKYIYYIIYIIHMKYISYKICYIWDVMYIILYLFIYNTNEFTKTDTFSCTYRHTRFYHCTCII